MNRRVPLLAATLVAALLAACTGGPSATSSTTPAGTLAGSGPRTISVTMTDALRFEPAAFNVAVGESVRFEVTNGGQAVHEFYIGDEAAQAEHEHEMREMDGGMMHDEPSGISVAPGETESLDYTFEEPGELLVGCHEPGHYDGGMVATITVE